MTTPVTGEEITEAAARIESHVRHTPVLDIGQALSDRYITMLKLEHLQMTGSFKVRGAFALLTAVDVAGVGVVAASGGNFGIAVAYAAERLGIPAVVFVPATSPREKIGRISGYGAKVEVVAGFYDQALEAARRHADETGAFQAHAYDQREVVAGQGTLALELEGQAFFDVIVVAVGGGGLIGGIAAWLRERAEVVAVEPVLSSSFNSALRAGQRVDVEVGGVAASSLGARIVGEHLWVMRNWVDHTVLVDDADIVAAQHWLWEETRLAVEPAAAATVAALRTGAYRPPDGARVALVLSGGNVDPSTVSE